jgi:hypothetical protein
MLVGWGSRFGLSQWWSLSTALSLWLSRGRKVSLDLEVYRQHGNGGSSFGLTPARATHTARGGVEALADAHPTAKAVGWTCAPARSWTIAPLRKSQTHRPWRCGSPGRRRRLRRRQTWPRNRERSRHMEKEAHPPLWGGEDAAPDRQWRKHRLAVMCSLRQVRLLTAPPDWPPRRLGGQRHPNALTLPRSRTRARDFPGRHRPRAPWPISPCRQSSSFSLARLVPRLGVLRTVKKLDHCPCPGRLPRELCPTQLPAASATPTERYASYAAHGLRYRLRSSAPVKHTGKAVPPSHRTT